MTWQFRRVRSQSLKEECYCRLWSREDKNVLWWIRYWSIVMLICLSLDNIKFKKSHRSNCSKISQYSLKKIFMSIFHDTYYSYLFNLRCFCLPKMILNIEKCLLHNINDLYEGIVFKTFLTCLFIITNITHIYAIYSIVV